MEKRIYKNLIFEGKPLEIKVEGGQIAAIGTSLEEEGCDIFDGRGMTLVPGLVNAHLHSSMTMLRGVVEDVPLMQWLDQIWAIEEHMDEEVIAAGAELAFLEMIKSGTTSFYDMYWMMPVVRSVGERMGLRGVYSAVLLDNFNEAKSAENQELCLSQYESSLKWGELSKFAISLHGEYTNSESNILFARQMADSHGIPLQVHLCETKVEVDECRGRHGGLTPVEYLDSLGFLGPDVSAAHALWLTENDIKILADRGVSVVHNINSNLKLGSGNRFLYKELREAGVNVCLGTDGAASSNNLDMREVMKTAALSQKGWRCDPTVMSVEELKLMVSECGAKAIGLDSGVIAPGRPADFILVRTDGPEFIPRVNFWNSFIYAAGSSCIDTVVCNGRLLMHGRHVEGEERIIENAARVAERFYKTR